MSFPLFKGKVKLDAVPKDVVGIDFGGSGTRAVRIVNEKGRFTLTQIWETEDLAASELSLPRNMKARACAIAVSHPDGMAKLLSVPRPANKLDDVPFVELLGVENPMAFRMALEIQDSSATETSVLMAAIPLTTVNEALGHFSMGFPAPQAMELAGLAAINGAMLCMPNYREQSVILLDLGADMTTVAITIPEKLAFLRQFRIGANAVLRKLSDSLGMDAVTVRDAVGEGMIDATEQVKAAFDPLMRQILLGRDFVTRRHSVRPASLLATGGLFQTPFWLTPFRNALGVEASAWNPFTSLTVANNAVTPEVSARGTRFAAAAGVALAVLKEGGGK